MFMRNTILFTSCLFLVQPLWAMEAFIKEDEINYVDKESLPGGENGECYTATLSEYRSIRVISFDTGPKKNEIECFLYVPLYSPGTSVTYKYKIPKKYFGILKQRFQEQQRLSKK